MALQKLKTLENGESGEYWRITTVSFDKSTMTLELGLSLYKSEFYKNLKPISLTKIYKFILTIEESSLPLMSLAYQKIKAYSNTLIQEPTLDEIDADGNIISRGLPAIYQDMDLAGSIDV